MPAPSGRVDRSLSGEKAAVPRRLHEPKQSAEPVVAPREGCHLCEYDDATRLLHDMAWRGLSDLRLPQCWSSRRHRWPRGSRDE
jgi:hypothetical protein